MEGDVKKKKRIAEMEIGDTGYTFPDSLWIDADNDCFLNEDGDAYKFPTETKTLKITKVNGGYVAFIHEISHMWVTNPVPPFSSANNALCYGKVVGFHDVLPDQFRRDSLIKQMQEAIEQEDYELAGEIKKKLILN